MIVFFAQRRYFVRGLLAETRVAVDEQRANLAAAQVAVGADADAQVAVDRAIKEAYVSGFRMAMLFAAGLAATGALASWAMVEGKRGESGRVPAEGVVGAKT